MRSRRADADPGTLEVHDLRRVPHLAATIGDWLGAEWYGAHADVQLARLQGQLESAPAGGFPAAFVGCVDGQPVGCFVLARAPHPLSGQPLLCLSNLFVCAAWRGRGLGRRLCAAALSRARGWSIPRVSLFTATHADWYAAQGWRAVQLVPSASGRPDEPVLLMQASTPVGTRGCLPLE